MGDESSPSPEISEIVDRKRDLKTFVSDLIDKLPKIPEIDKKQVIQIIGLVAVAAVFSQTSPEVESKMETAVSPAVLATPNWSEMIAAMSTTKTAEDTEKPIPTKTPTATEATSPPSKKVTDVFVPDSSLAPERTPAPNTVERAYIRQGTENTCGGAVMAMMIADMEQRDVRQVYREIMGYYDFANRPDLFLGPSAVVDYLERFYPNVEMTRRRNRITKSELKGHIDKFGPTIVDVTSHYGRESVKNPANHWIILDEIITEEDGSLSAQIRDPLRSRDTPGTGRELLPFMEPGKDGSIIIPVEQLLPALGDNYINVITKPPDKAR